MAHNMLKVVESRGYIFLVFLARPAENILPIYIFYIIQQKASLQHFEFLT